MKKYILKIKFEILLQILFSIIEAIALAGLAYLPKIIFDFITDDSKISSNSIIILIGIFCILSLISVIASYFEMIFIWKYAIKFENLIKKDYFQAVIKYKDIEFHKKDISEYVSIQSNDIMQIEQDYLTPLVSAINQIIKIIVFGIVMFVGIDWRIATVVFIASIIAAILPKYTGNKAASKRLIFVDKLGQYTNLIYDFFRGFREINSRTAKNIINRNSQSLDETKNSRYEYGKNKSISLALNRFTRTLVQMLGFIMVVILLYRKEISIGTCIATFGFITSFIDPLEEILYCFTTMRTVKDVKEKVFSILNENKIDNKTIRKEFKNTIEIKNLVAQNSSFELKNISYTFEKNKHYGIIGHNGCGKSTFMNAIMEYIPLNSGQILIDGENLHDYKLEWLISYVLQKSHIFATNYSNNITMFDSYKNNSKEILENIGLSQEIINKIETQENSENLSGGEKQILAYIRARNSKTPILILDEPFSAVDQSSKKLLMKDIASLKNKTILMITHDIDNSLSYFDEIIELKEGSIIKAEKKAI